MKTENIGWQCPNCLIVYAPSVEKCECSVLLKKSYSEIGTTTTGTTQICFGYISESPNGVCSKCGQPEWHHLNISYT